MIVGIFHVFCILFFNGVSCTVHLMGATNLDSFTFDKLVSKFKVSVVKFDIALPYGDKEEEFGLVAELLRFSPDILVGEVGIRDYGEIRNVDLGDRFGVKRSDFPVVKVFVQGKEEPVTFTGKRFTADKMNRFIKKHSSVRIVLDYCIQEFDELAEKFIDTKEPEEKTHILEQARELSQNLRNEESVHSAEVYIEIMEKIIEKGTGVLRKEKNRAKKMDVGVMNTPENIKEMQTILNILQSFKLGRPKDEL